MDDEDARMFMKVWFGARPRLVSPLASLVEITRMSSCFTSSLSSSTTLDRGYRDGGIIITHHPLTPSLDRRQS